MKSSVVAQSFSLVDLKHFSKKSRFSINEDFIYFIKKIHKLPFFEINKE